MKILLLVLFLNYKILESKVYKASIINWVPVPLPEPSAAAFYSSTKIWNTLNNIKNAEKSDIYIFPEYTYANKNYFELGYTPRDHAFDVPEESKISLCNVENNIGYQYLKNVSCAAQKKRIYVIIHVIEKGPKNTLYNTILVFNREGSLQKKHRKINLSEYEQKYFTPGKSFTTFTTDFNVNFILLTSEDIFIYDPKIHSLKNDIILCSSMYASMPFLNDVSLFDGFSKKYQSNLLAATTNVNYSGASGFYGINNDKAHYYEKQYYMINNTIETHIYNDRCKNAEKPLTGILAVKPINIDNYNNRDYQLRQLKNGTNKFHMTSADKKVVCEFNVKLYEKQKSYNAALAYSNGGAYGCAIVACKTKAITSCGGIVESNANEMNDVVIHTKFADVDIDIFNYPISLNTKLEPIGEYTYCTDKNGISLRSKGPLTEMLTLGYYGRDPHGKNSGSYTKASMLTATFMIINLLQFLS